MTDTQGAAVVPKHRSSHEPSPIFGVPNPLIPEGETAEPDSNSSSIASSSTVVAPSPSIWGRIHSIVTYTPQRCRYDPANPPGFSVPLNLLFGFATTFTVANLYYKYARIFSRDYLSRGLHD